MATAPLHGTKAEPALPVGWGVLVVGHGTADAVGAAETHAACRAVAAALPDAPVELGFLEVIGPTLADGLAALAARGCRDVVAAPLLLFAAGHAKRDVPEALEAGARAAGVRVLQADPLGCHPAIVALSRRRRAEALAGRAGVAADAWTLVMAGRGSSDPAAPGQLRELAQASLDGEPAPRRLHLGFVAAARPTLAEAIAAAADPADPGVRRIVVQPHLLFRGHVEDQVAAAVAHGRGRRPDVEWVQVERLGPDPLVAMAVVARAVAAAGESVSRQG